MDFSRLSYILLGLLVVGVLVLFFCKRKTKEGFKVLGTLANQNEIYYSCLSGCEKADPIDQLGRTVGSATCLDKCDFVGTALADVTEVPGISTGIPKIRVDTVEDQSYQVCGDGSDFDRCRLDYVTRSNVLSKCAQDCKFSNLPYARCVEQCNKSHRGAYIDGWTRKWGA